MSTEKGELTQCLWLETIKMHPKIPYKITQFKFLAYWPQAYWCPCIDGQVNTAPYTLFRMANLGFH